eukprot:TRINITY_DN1730_c0_g1_i1.p1 TRINITY_DN1730_c0_g1~~TRINITY_DN1730_c0_g1_i1.p1  ORF type:complete len:599 (+),score=172.14 TRINITY_DN1730_c0_g1_i1:1630-3426(+)
MERVAQLSGQLLPNPLAGKEPRVIPRSKNKLDWFKDKGWGFRDTEFSLNKEGHVMLTGSRYLFSGYVLPELRPWAEKHLGLDIGVKTPAQNVVPVDPPILNEDFLAAIRGKVDEVSTDPKLRVHHSHGHTMQEIFALRHGKLARAVDVIVFVTEHAQVEEVVLRAVEHGVAVIPYGGGTNVTHALLVPENERRCVVSLDVTRMNKVKWVDRKNMKACVEAGIIGRDLEAELARYGVVCGHEPDSVEFSSLGGWVATRASGMKKNSYGNIDDIVLQIKTVTPRGTLIRGSDSPRISSGPALDEIVLGSEGTLGVVTEVIIKVRDAPEVKEFDSIVFPDFDTGVRFMHDVAKSRLWPASIRLVDNTQFQFALALKPLENSTFKVFKSSMQKFFLSKIKGFDLSKIAVVTIVYEGSARLVESQQESIKELSARYGGIHAGGEAGERGYFLTFMIAYLRDFAFDYSYIAESFETSASWTDVTTLCRNVQNRINEECRKRGVKKTPWVSYRVTQVYDTGAAIYIYFGFHYQGVPDAVQTYSEIEDAAREEILKSGGCISHHHGVGKLRKKFMKDSVGDTGVRILEGVKKAFDPNNTFANGNLV